MMLVAFWLWWKLLQHLSTKDNERNFCQDLLTKTPTQTCKCTSCAMQMSYLYASDFHSKKLLQSRQTSRTKTIKNRVWLWLSIVCETHKLTRHQSRGFSRTTFLYRTTPKITRTAFIRVLQLEQIFSFTARNWSLVFDPAVGPVSRRSRKVSSCTQKAIAKSQYYRAVLLLLS